MKINEEMKKGGDGPCASFEPLSFLVFVSAAGCEFFTIELSKEINENKHICPPTM